MGILQPAHREAELARAAAEVPRRYWPPALIEWSTAGVRDAFYSSPQLPRLLNPEIIKRAICDGVTQGLLGYATKDSRGNIKLQKLKESLFDTEVELSEDVYILKAEDAQKLLEPARLARLVIRPEQATIKASERAEFSVSAQDQYNQPFPTPAVQWSAKGGAVTNEGVFTAGDTGGVYSVHAQASGLEAVAEVRIVTKDTPPPPPPPGKRTVSWHGDVPPQKWMNFYTKVLTRFTSSPGLKLEVSFQVPLEPDQADSKVDEARSGLKELGLDDTVQMS
ncbi:MAG: hypothetical protein GXY83_03400 [Rhodopirellula sp.]|nr:hypothetical protein [Rhodopirellula sp.]